ncbi:hypothetical protein quinque_008710 [Culex quinquefasciatus]
MFPPGDIVIGTTESIKANSEYHFCSRLLGESRFGPERRCTKRFDSEKAGDREVQRTMLELLNQLDGFSSTADIKVIAATNRVDILDPALLRSGRLDRKIEFPHPNEEARARIMQIHSRKMNVSPDVNFEELARSTDDFNGAQCKAVCVEAGMIALRRSAVAVTHEDFMDAIMEVQAKKKANLNYYA